MNERIKQAFAQIHAEDTLKQNTYEYVLRKAQGRRVHRIRAIAAASIACAAITAGGSMLFFTPTSVISIDVNPSVELAVNRFDRVISVDGRNDDGTQFAAGINVRFEDYAAAVDKVLQSLRLSEDDVVSITVAGENESKSDIMLENVQNSAAVYNQAHCYSTELSEVADAHDLGLSCGKYRAFLELQQLDPSVTAEEVQTMTMSEIHERIIQLGGTDTSGSVGHDEPDNHHSEEFKTGPEEEPETVPSQSSGCGEQTIQQPSGHMSGHGHGHGHGH